MSYSIVLTEKFKKGTDARLLATYETYEQADKRISEINWAARRGSPTIVETSKVESFIRKKQTGIYAPDYEPPTQEELKTQYEKEKARQKEQKIKEAGGESAYYGQDKRLYTVNYAGQKYVTANPSFRPQAYYEDLAEYKEYLNTQKDRTVTVSIGNRLTEVNLGLTAKGKVVEFGYRPLENLNIAKDSDFFPQRPTVTTETMTMPMQQLKYPRNMLLETATISAGHSKDLSIIPSPVTLDFNAGQLSLSGYEKQIYQYQQKTKQYESQWFKIQKGGSALVISDLTYGFDKMIKAIPEAAGFGVLAAASPPTALTVGAIYTTASIPALQKEFAEFGIGRTIAREAPTFFLFGAAGTAGAKLRSSTAMSEAAFNVKIEDFYTRNIDRTFTFENKPYLIETTSTKPLQRTLTGYAITQERVNFLRRELDINKPYAEPTTLKELRAELDVMGARPITRQQAAELNIYNPSVELSTFREVDMTELQKIDMGYLAPVERQTQLRPSYPTPQQSAVATMEYELRIQPKNRNTQLELFPFNNKRGQFSLLPPELKFNIDFGGMLEGVKTGLDRFKSSADLPRISARESLLNDNLVFPAFYGEEDIMTSQTTKAAQFAFPEIAISPLQSQELGQFQEPVIDIDILQTPITRQSQSPDIALDTLQEQSLKQDLLMIDLPMIDIGKPSRTARRGEPEREELFDFGFKGLSFGNMNAMTNQGYDVMIREKGQNLKANQIPLPRNKALNLGADIVDNSAAASFRLRKSKKPTNAIDDSFFALKNKFRSPSTKSSLPPSQFIERRTFRIDSAGERAGITAKGLIARRRKSQMDNFFGNIEL